MTTLANIPPVLLIAYKRPAATKRVFDEIRKAKPKKLFFAVDGPKKDNLQDAEKVNEVRKIIQNVDWDCEVQTLFAEKNLGSKIAESSAINFFFDNVEEGIILEDDCLPNLSFFNFCRELLEKYRDDERIMHISGNNFQLGRIVSDESYYFSRYNHVWGWATWKRAWRYYDVNMVSFPKFKSQNQIINILDDRMARQHFLKMFEKTYKGEIDCWDIQWAYAFLCQNGLSIVPNKNLVTNIGFGPDGTYCTDENDLAANIASNALENIVHPEFVVLNREADEYEFRKFNCIPIGKRFKLFLKRAAKFLRRPRYYFARLLESPVGDP